MKSVSDQSENLEGFVQPSNFVPFSTSNYSSLVTSQIVPAYQFNLPYDNFVQRSAQQTSANNFIKDGNQIFETEQTSLVGDLVLSQYQQFSGSNLPHTQFSSLNVTSTQEAKPLNQENLEIYLKRLYQLQQHNNLSQQLGREATPPPLSSSTGVSHLLSRGQSYCSSLPSTPISNAPLQEEGLNSSFLSQQPPQVLAQPPSLYSYMRQVVAPTLVQHTPYGASFSSPNSPTQNAPSMFPANCTVADRSNPMVYAPPLISDRNEELRKTAINNQLQTCKSSPSKTRVEMLNNVNKTMAPREKGVASSHTEEAHRPSLSYASLIAQSIFASKEKKLTLHEIYEFISNAYPYFELRKSSSWQNSVRHNLSVNRCFQKDMEVFPNGKKIVRWKINPDFANSFTSDGTYLSPRKKFNTTGKLMKRVRNSNRLKMAKTVNVEKVFASSSPVVQQISSCASSPLASPFHSPLMSPLNSSLENDALMGTELFNNFKPSSSFLNNPSGGELLNGNDQSQNPLLTLGSLRVDSNLASVDITLPEVLNGVKDSKLSPYQAERENYNSNGSGVEKDDNNAFTGDWLSSLEDDRWWNTQ